MQFLLIMGYSGSHDNAAQVVGNAGDKGIDGIINENHLGLDRLVRILFAFAYGVSLYY